jgi:hypothetical protein
MVLRDYSNDGTIPKFVWIYEHLTKKGITMSQIIMSFP